MADPRYDVTSIGEMLLRLSVPSGIRLETATKLDLDPAGSEANVMSLLARLERRVSWVGALPRNSLGQLAVNALRSAGVDTSGIVWHEQGRMGTYFVEFGESPRGIQVTYDRENSCASQLRVEELDWDVLLDTRLLHLTGITPALSPSCHEVVVEAVMQARQRDIPISFDVNYRQKLWSESAAESVLLQMMRGIEIVLCSKSDAMRLFGCGGTAQDVASQMLEKTRSRYLVMTIGAEGALLWNGKTWSHEPTRVSKMIDRLGAGDALAAGVIHGWLAADVVRGLRYGATLAALALTQHGDMVITNSNELEKLSEGDATLNR